MDLKLMSPGRGVCLICQVARQARRSPQWPRSIATESKKRTRTRTPQEEQRRHASSRVSSQVLGSKKGAHRHPPAQQKVRRLSSQESREIQALADAVLHHPSIPSEAETLHALEAINDAARDLLGVDEDFSSKNPKPNDKSPASTILSLEERPPSPTHKPPPSENINFLSDLAYRLLIADRVDITPDLLKLYIRTQSILSRPATLPQILELYATKPVPTATPNGIQYKSQTPKRIANAIPTSLADLALSTSLHGPNRHLPTALAIITATYRAPAFQRSKLFRKAFPPAALFSLFPIASYTLATRFASMQTALPPEDMTMYAFLGFGTYTLAMGTIGYQALTTRNDQMERVTWIIGMPLWERWAREEERAAGERVAKAWGFKDKYKWGEEEGREWAVLKEWLGVRGMVLDKVGLMEGME